MAYLASAAIGSTLKLTGAENAIQFAEGGAKLWASCPSDKPQGVRSFNRASIDYNNLYSDPTDVVKATLLNVPPTCIGVPIEKPCASYNADTPSLFHCVWEFGNSKKISDALPAHREQDIPGSYDVYVECPEPAFQDILDLGWVYGDGNVKLSVYHYAPTPEAGDFTASATLLPFMGLKGGNLIDISGINPPPSPPPTSPPAPPITPIPSPPPPLTPPPPSPTAVRIKYAGNSGPKYFQSTCESCDYDCQAKQLCDHVTGENCQYQTYSCSGGGGSYFPPSKGGSSNFNFARAYDFSAPNGNYGNICDCVRTGAQYGLYTGHQFCGLGHWYPSPPARGCKVGEADGMGIVCTNDMTNAPNFGSCQKYTYNPLN